jgi:hypothetical protein
MSVYSQSIQTLNKPVNVPQLRVLLTTAGQPRCWELLSKVIPLPSAVQTVFVTWTDPCTAAPTRAPGCTGSELVFLELPLLGPTRTGS